MVIFAAMLVVVNTRLLIPDRLDGIGRFTDETLKRITQMRPDDHFVFLFDREVDERFIYSDNITPVKLFPPARRPWLYNLWLNWSVRGVLRDLKPDLFYSPDGFLPLNTQTPCLPVIHDLNFEHYPQDLSRKYSKWYRKNFPLFAQKGERILTVSEFSKADIADRYTIDATKIDVVYNAASEAFQPLEADAVKAVREQYSGGAPYFLFVGALHPRKNLVRLVEAFVQYKQKHPTATKLLITGAPYWKYHALDSLLAQLPDKKEVVFTGRLSDEELVRITGAAHAVTYLPYFEGFGIPIVEAMACRVPVLTANVTSMPEVGGDAALYADPFDVAAIAAALEKIDNDQVLRAQLIDKAAQRSKAFSWQESAEKIWTCMEQCVHTHA
ncbi:MAG: glycosyltransferase family 4 protein [Bacteroidetes bacterium]|nr:glycosyltransferase family 4 protein [Bacteroidota bacterium]